MPPRSIAHAPLLLLLAAAPALAQAPPLELPAEEAPAEAPAPSGPPEVIALRPIDRATVRVMGVSGIVPTAGVGRLTGVRRVGAEPSVGHGSGVAISPRLVLTARHVVWGASAWAVIPPGGSSPIPARPLYVDVDADLAVVVVDRDLRHFIELPEVRTLTMSERVSVSGYPLDLREPNPASASGEVSRVTRDGQLHLSMDVNPGNSGGPVIDADGRLIGIVSARGAPERGIEGLAVAVPLGAVLAARARVPEGEVRFEAYEADLARAIGLLAALEDAQLSVHADAVRGIVERIEGASGVRPEHELVVAALAWNTTLSMMEEARAAEAADLSGASRVRVGPIYRGAVLMARHALTAAPHVRRRFPVVRPIALGRTAPFGRSAR